MAPTIPSLRGPWHVPLLAAVLGLLLVPVSFATVFGVNADAGPCPAGPAAAPTEVRFTPGLVEHGSWLDVAVLPQPYLGPTAYVLCLDGRVLAEQHAEWDGAGVSFPLRTRWVDAHWLRGDLAALADPARWRMVALPCDAPQAQGADCL